MRDLLLNRAQVRARLPPQGRVLLLLDFDGTLSPLASEPEKALLPQPVREILLRLDLRPRIRIAILSGRPLDFLKTAFGVRSFYYGGNHGLEMEGPDFSFCHPGACAIENVLKKLVRLFRDSVRGVPGALLEDKRLTLAFHYRNVSLSHMPAFDSLIGAFQDQTDHLPVRWRAGKKVWELVPRLDWNKGRAADALIRHLGHPFPIAMGDDRTDEDMFEALSGDGITVHVGGDGESCAQFYLRRQSDVPRFLRFVDAVLN